MPPMFKSTSVVDQGETPPSKNLWIGSLNPDVTEAELQAVFQKHGEIDSITSYAARTYAFVYFRNLEDAKSAKESLQGYVIRGNAIKIEFAKPAKPCKSLWVAGISQSVTKEDLEKEFLKFGNIQEFKILRDRTAYIDYFKLEDASLALKNMNGKRIGGDNLRVDYLRSQTARRDQWPDSHDTRGQFHARIMNVPDARFMQPDLIRNYHSDPIHAGSKRHLFQTGGRVEDGQPSNILWISYPPTVHVDEDMLHNAMILFGEIERIKSFPERNYSFVEFRSVDEAMLAKGGLQGKLFNDPRIMIEYSSSDSVFGKEASSFHLGIKGPRPDLYFNEGLYRPGQVGEGYNGTNRSVLQPQMLPLRGIRSSFEHGNLGTDLSEMGPLQTDWRRSSPGSSMGILPSPSVLRVQNKSNVGGWDIYDPREAKRSRMDNNLEYGLEDQYGMIRNDSVSLTKLLHSPVDQGRGVMSSGIRGRNSDNNHIWRGVIAKGGSLVCNARCVPLDGDFDYDIPEVVNCSARTGLDLLTKHYGEAVGFNIVFFLPDSEDDFGSYTEFLRYLGSKDRAGVAKFDDGTTMFLVPPSDFLTKVLNVVGPERLYGVVLKFGQHGISSSSSSRQHVQQQVPQLPQYVDKQQIQSVGGYNKTVMPLGLEERVEYTREKLKGPGVGGIGMYNKTVMPLGMEERVDYTREKLKGPGLGGIGMVSSGGYNNNNQTITPLGLEERVDYTREKSKGIGVGGIGMVSSLGYNNNNQTIMPLGMEERVDYTREKSKGPGVGGIGMVSSGGYNNKNNNQTVMPPGMEERVDYTREKSKGGPSGIGGSGVSITPDLIATLTKMLPTFSGQEGVGPGHGTGPTQWNNNTHTTEVAAPQGYSAYTVDSTTVTSSSGYPQTGQVSSLYNQQQSPQYQSGLLGMMAKGNNSTSSNAAAATMNNQGGFGHNNNVAQTSTSTPLLAPICEADIEKNQRYQTTLQFAADLLSKIQRQSQGSGGSH